MSKRWLLIAAMGMVWTVAQADPERTRLTREDQTPLPGQWEVGLKADYLEVQDEIEQFRAGDFNTWDFTPYARTAVGDLALSLSVPYVTYQPDVGDSQQGLGDVGIGVALPMYEDIFEYPYIMPYADVFLPTGDEDKNLGVGEATYNLGAVIGTTVDDDWHVGLDLRYHFDSSEENIGIVGVHVIRDLNKKCALIGEVQSSEKLPGQQDNDVRLEGGIIYRPNRFWMVSFYGGKNLEGRDDAFGGMKISRTLY